MGLDNLVVGLLPGVTVLGVMLFSNERQGEKSRVFLWGFTASLIFAIAVYLVCCLAIPDGVRRPVVYYINEIEPSLYDADLAVVYRLSLEIQGLILGLPQLLFALAGGVAFQFMARTSHHTAAKG